MSDEKDRVTFGESVRGSLEDLYKQLAADQLKDYMPSQRVEAKE